MTTNTYLIIGGVAIVFIAYLLFLKSMMKKRNQQLQDNFDKNHSDLPLSDEQKRLLTFGAILFYFRDEKILDLKPQDSLSSYVGGLKQQWGITNETEAKAALKDLLNLKRSNEFELVMLHPSEELEKIQKSIADGLGIEKSVVAQIKCVYAWDICRAISLAKWCYWVGYLKQDEAWAAMKEAADIAIKNGDNWQDYTISFLLGRTIQGFDLDDIIIGSKQLFHSKSPALRNIEDIDVYERFSFKGS